MLGSLRLQHWREPWELVVDLRQPELEAVIGILRAVDLAKRPACQPVAQRQAVYGRLACYEDVNDAERLACDPAMRAIVGREGIDRPAASTSQMGRFETEWLPSEANLEALTNLSGAWIDRVHQRRPPDGIILDME